jgi:uncharacterized membrane protein
MADAAFTPLRDRSRPKPRRQTEPAEPNEPAVGMVTACNEVLASAFASEWEVRFCTDLLNRCRGRALSPKQRESLRDAWRRARRRRREMESRVFGKGGAS